MINQIFNNIPLENVPWERIIGFSFPKDGNIVVISYDGIHTVSLKNRLTFFSDSNYLEGGEIYDHKNQELKYEGFTFRILGLYGGKPILKSKFNERLELNTSNQNLKVYDNQNNQIINFNYEDLSGDWAIATFSEDGEFLLLGLPYELFIFKRH